MASFEGRWHSTARNEHILAAVSGERPAGQEGRGDALERATAAGPGRQVKQRPERAINQRRRLVKREFTHVALAHVALAHLAHSLVADILGSYLASPWRACLHAAGACGGATVQRDGRPAPIQRAE